MFNQHKSVWSFGTSPVKKKRHGVFGFQRISDNRYSIAFDTLEYARKIGVDLKTNQPVRFPIKIALGEGRPVVLDVSVAGYEGLMLSLIYKVDAHERDSTLITWWPRRRTDPDLLDLWIELVDILIKEGDMPKSSLELAGYVFEYFRISTLNDPLRALGFTEGDALSEESLEERLNELVELGHDLMEHCKAELDNSTRLETRLYQSLIALQQAYNTLKEAAKEDNASDNGADS